MGAVRYLYDEIAVVGWSCRLPGANSISELWSLLLEGRCPVSVVPVGRFDLKNYWHPRRHERGKCYTFAAGVLDDVWGFDPSVFGISPREAEQMDPQQRILLQLTWEALEDAGIPPSTIAGTEVGVYVGASQTDYAHAVISDLAIADSHFATGNALAIVANRISHVYDLHGPSIAIDTACSSSLVALHQAAEALRAGRIDTAIVGGINVIASPAEFISFSQAGMLSPTGLCRAFSADADGYVRAEGGAVLILRKSAQAHTSRNPVRGIIVASDVNSDGRTTGISLPSGRTQEALLARVYARAGISPERLSFIEAHGTGTPVGDPIEAGALGCSLGIARSEPLPIGSIKTNIGHLEAASGLAGLIKALLALQHGILPASLHFAKPNPNIDFGGLNLNVCNKPLLLPAAAQHCAGVNSFGFGGTNAHVVVAPGKPAPDVESRQVTTRDGFFAFSAETEGALKALALKYAERVAHLPDHETAAMASAIAHRRNGLSKRVVVSTTRTESVSAALNAFLLRFDHRQLDWGDAVGQELPVAFVYSGNGSQWVGMGIAAYEHNATFRDRFSEIDVQFGRLAGWSLTEALLSKHLGDRLPLTHIAQPLVFAIQSAATEALRARGVLPSVVLGHSVGEVAAAEAAGILDLRTAVEVIHARSARQEQVKGAGRMAAMLAAPEVAARLIDTIPGVEIAAFNSPRTTTVAGSAEALARLNGIATGLGVALLDLDLDYPFHTGLMAPIEAQLVGDLANIAPKDEIVPFVSTVTGTCIPGVRLDGGYWWRNVREPVQFQQGIREVAKLGARFFAEIGPRGVLLKHISDSLEGEVSNIVAISVFERGDGGQDPINKVVSRAIISGARIDTDVVFGSNPGTEITLPFYPWQQQQFRYGPTVDAVGVAKHPPFRGARRAPDALEWYAHIDTTLFPELADHRVGERIIFPGTAFVEISFAVAQEWLQSQQVILADFDILNPLDLTNGETREVMSRVSPVSNTVEVFSRPRLSDAGWALHCRSKMLRGHGRTPEAPSRPAAFGQALGRDTIYRVAEASGLRYGPAFRLLANAELLAGDLVKVELGTTRAGKGFAIDPIGLDACCHGLLAVFPELQTVERGVCYLPVRLDEATLFVSGVSPRRAVIEISRKDDRAIIADYRFYGPGDELLAVFRGVRCQAVQVRRTSTLEANAFVEFPQLIDGAILGLQGMAGGTNAVLQLASRCGARDGVATSSEADVLLDGFATVASFEIATALADDGAVDVDGLLVTDRLSQQLRPWFVSLLQHLKTAGLAEKYDDQWVLLNDPLLPSAASVVEELARKCPERAAELLIAGAIAGLVERVAGERALTLTVEEILPSKVFDFYDTAGVTLREASDVLSNLTDTATIWPVGRAVKVLQIGAGPLTQSLLAMKERRTIELSILHVGRPRPTTAVEGGPTIGEVVFLEAEPTLDGRSFDLILAVDSLHRLPKTVALSDLREALAPRGLLIAVEPRPSLFRNLVFGLDPSWFEAGGPYDPLGPLRPSEAWPRELKQVGFAQAQAQSLNVGSLIVATIAAQQSRERSHAPEGSDRALKSALIVEWPDASDDHIGATLAVALRNRGCGAAVGHPSDVSDLSPDTLIYILPTDDGPGEPVDLLTERCLALKASAEAFGSASARLWFVFRGALASRSPVRPLATGVWGFSRTLANEFPHLDVRRIDIAPHVPHQTAIFRLSDIILSDTSETELQVDDGEVRAVRATPLGRVVGCDQQAPPAAARLARRLTAGQRFCWEAIERTPPAADEVEIEVVASGVNFRDVMSLLGLLPDEIIEDGVTGPSLGCECAGRVTRVGNAVRHLGPGDRVAAFAAGAFATHVTVAATQVAKLPAELGYEAGATIPVAFLTAFYALVTQAKLRRGEWVLVHGGAGGVGMAAIQIAQTRGARIIATAGSAAKRDLLRALGVPHVLDSRSTSFVDDVRTIHANGVDVVLNSLAGEAMERSLGCLGEFGRFVELGKRDYVNNTHIGLRPFRKNLTYFGVDLDQIMRRRRGLAKSIHATLMRQFERGVLVPLPYSVFSASGVTKAFHLMQHSGHIGKIVVCPPDLGSVQRPSQAIVINPTGTHVITGGFGGFGLEAARWLVDRGARDLVLIGRKGAITDEAKAALAEFANHGVRVVVETCDVSNKPAVEQVFARISVTMPPIAGILHAAMVLDDGLLSNLNRERFERVLGPKVKGAEVLDCLTRGMSLDYFVLFSSATTLVGNPGQANYVAANAFMEGIARRRRQEGLKGLAIGWGPITDVGVLARSERLRSRFHKLTGVRGMTAREAMDLMAQALEQSSDTSPAVMTISPTEGIFNAGRLRVLTSPTYGNLVGSKGVGPDNASAVDLRVIAKAEGLDGVRRKLTDVVIAQLAQVLRARQDEISQVRPLADIGLDSLMALEFAMNLEEAFGIHVSLTSSVGSLTVTSLVNDIASQLTLDNGHDQRTIKTITDLHMTTADLPQIAILEEIVTEVDIKRKGMLP